MNDSARKEQPVQAYLRGQRIVFQNRQTIKCHET